MAQLKFTKLKLKVDDTIKTFVFNEETVEITQYLPIKDKITIVSDVVKQAMTGRILRSDFLEVYLNLAIIDYYTNITFTDKQREKNADLYDMFESSGLLDLIISSIPEAEYEELVDNVNDYAAKLSKMSNSMVTGYSAHTEGMKDAIQQVGANYLEETLSGIVNSEKDEE